MLLARANVFVDAAHAEAEALGVPLKGGMPAVIDGPGELTVSFEAQGGRVLVRMDRDGETLDVRFRPSFLRRLFRL